VLIQEEPQQRPRSDADGVPEDRGRRVEVGGEAREGDSEDEGLDGGDDRSQQLLAPGRDRHPQRPQTHAEHGQPRHGRSAGQVARRHGSLLRTLSSIHA
jgi:hypothetical protein